MLDRARSPLPWLAGLLALYLLAPIVAFVVRLGGGVSSAPGLGAALVTSLVCATISAALIATLGIPLAYLLAHGRSGASRLALALVALPLALPPLMSGLLLLYVVGPYTAAGRLFGGELTDTRVGIVLAQTFVAAPFAIVAARAAFAAVDPALEDMARALGHGRLARFWRVAVPAALPGIGAGLVLAWLRSFGEFGATVILAYHPYSLPVFAFVQFGASGLAATMLPVAVALAVALAFLLSSGMRASRRRPRRAGAGGGDAPWGPAARAAGGPSPGPARWPGTAAPSPAPAARASAPLDFAVSKRLGDFSLQLAHRASSPRLALLGPSGAGKTLTLRLLAGLTASEGGHVKAGSRALHLLACERREIGYVPQQSALLPRRSVWRQVTFGARARPQLAAWWLQRLGLAGLEDRYPEELSGGQQRRVALARALAIEPRVLLLDEPFTALDAPVRDQLRRDLRALQRDSELCTVIVTHDPEEAAMLAEEIIVIDDGRALQAGPRAEVFHSPACARVAALLGIANARHERVAAPDTLTCAGVEIHTPTGALAPGTEVVWCVRPERIGVLASGDGRGGDGRGGDDGDYAASLLDEVDLGAVRELTVALSGALELTVRTAQRGALAANAQLRLRIAPGDVAVWRLEQSGEREGEGEGEGSVPAAQPPT
jgi:ABC-type sulfate/molybdate transport systems ATPase subunit/ABC-type sulfate transport system permease component